ncbi:hypothetical protein PRIPAC_96706 [Pristionchus pacificus]|nr:hypothetical protein PRIPAC_96706 [Pristionchus pacificus]|eukprot:PDM60278.1 hypothetical protein PRIPAC_54103 [Pristionchus pacificus]
MSANNSLSDQIRSLHMKPSSKSKPLGFLTVRIGRLSKDYRLQEKAEFPRFLERLGCGLRVSRVVLCGSMELVVCRRTQIRTPSQVAKPFVIDDETFLRMVDAQRVLMLKRGKVELTEHGLLAAFLAIADNPQPQYVEITVELMTAIKFMYFFGSELTWDGFMPSNQDYVHVFVKRCRKKGRTESLLVTIVNHRRSSIFLQTPVSQSLTEDTIAEIYNEPHMLARGNPWIFHSS